MDMKHVSEWIDWLKYHGLDIGLLIAGIFGSLLRVSNETEPMSLRRKFILLFSGGGTSAYLTPVLTNFLHLGENAQYGIAFIIGVMGMNAVDMLIGKIKNKMTTPTNEAD
jgi:hypothetical protein